VAPSSARTAGVGRLSKTRSSREPSGVSIRIGLSLRVAMSFRVSVPTTARLIGLAQPPRPWSLRTGPRGLFVGVATRVNQPPSSHALVTRVRNFSASILTPALTPEHAFVPAFARTATAYVRLRGFRCRHFAFGSLRRIPVHARRGRLVQRCRCSPTGRVYLSRLFPCRGPASLVSCRVVHGHHSLQRLLPAVAARPSRVALSSVPFPTLRCRSFEDFSYRFGCVLRLPTFSRRRWVAPLLVVFPPSR